MPPVLYILGGFPAAGKTTLASLLARRTGAVLLRADTIEQQMRDSGFRLRGPEGYEVAYRIAAENLRLGNDVISDSVNPIEVTRAAWRAVAAESGARAIEVEVRCSVQIVHRERAEARRPDIPNLVLPEWGAIAGRRVEPWPSADIVIETAHRTPEDCFAELAARLGIEPPAAIDEKAS